jgi:cAMP-dependent protein kinase regulator
MPGRAIAALKKLARIDPAALPDAGRRIASMAKQRDHEVALASLHRGAGERRLPPDEPASGHGAPAPASRSPLFSDFSADELAAVIHGLDLLSFAAGDLVMTEGEPGRSLFVVASGSLKVWVREGEGRSRLVRSLGEGDFFGEVSLLTGRRRTATVTAATHADLLELGWSRVEEIVRDHPRVADVLRAFCDERLKADVATRSEGQPGSETEPGDS